MRTGTREARIRRPARGRGGHRPAPAPAARPAAEELTLFGGVEASAPAEAPTLAPEGGERTLEDLLLGAWEELVAPGRGAAACPVCTGRMTARRSATAVLGGRCGDCGSALA